MKNIILLNIKIHPIILISYNLTLYFNEYNKVGFPI